MAETKQPCRATDGGKDRERFLGNSTATPAVYSRPLRVAIVTDFPRDPENPFGGVQAVSVHLVRGLAALGGLEIHVVTEDVAVTSRQESMWGTVTIHRLPRRGRNTLTNALGAGRQQITSFLNTLTPDVVHAHDIYGIMVKGLAIPRVFTIHGQIYKDTRVSGERLGLPRSWIWKPIELAGWRDQPHIISISPYVREQLSGIVTGSIHDIDNPIGLDCFCLNRCEKPGTVFSAGAITPRKNAFMLVKAFARLLSRGVSAELRLSGGGDSNYIRAISDYICEQGMAEKVTLLGRVSYRAIQTEMARASVFALISLEENSPMAIEEAMAAGVPVVASNRCGMPYLVRDGESGLLVDPEDADDIADCLERLLVHDEVRRFMGAKGREIALDRFHPTKVATRTRAVYERAIATPSPK